MLAVCIAYFKYLTLGTKMICMEFHLRAFQCVNAILHSLQSLA